MQVKKPSPSKKILTTSRSRPKLSPTKGSTTKSPAKSGTGKCVVGHHITRDFFNYTPLRQHKPLTCSTPDLHLNKSMIKDQPVQQILSNKKSILDQSDILQKKLKEFKKKINENRVIKSKDYSLPSSRRAPEKTLQILMMNRVLEKVLRKSERRSLQSTFYIIREISLNDLAMAKRIYENCLRKKCFRNLRKYVTINARADMHYKLQLMVRSFLRWNDLLLLEKSSTSIQTSDCSAESLSISKDLPEAKDLPEIVKDLPEIVKDLSENVKDLSENVKNLSENTKDFEVENNSESESELVMLADQFYASSLKHFMGIKPWKIYISRGRCENRLKKLSRDNYKCKLMMKAFNFLHKYSLDSTEKVKAFRKISVMQKCFCLMKIENIREEDEIKENVIERYRKVLYI